MPAKFSFRLISTAYHPVIPCFNLRSTVYSADLLLKLASEFGCTPAARARIHMAPEANLEPRGKFDGLIGRPTWGLTAEELRTNTRNPG